MKKVLIFLFTLVLLYSLYYFLNISLPYMSCGGSTEHGINNKCFPGFYCEINTIDINGKPAYIDGAGGICKPGEGPMPTNADLTPPQNKIINKSEEFYPLDFLLINVTRNGVSSSLITPVEHVLPNCGIQKWGGEQLYCDNSTDMITCTEYSGAYCRETNLLICGNIFVKDEILSKSVTVDFEKINLRCKNEVIDEYHLTRNCYQNNKLIYSCSGMSVPGIL